MRDLGYVDRESVWPIYLALVDDAAIPEVITRHPRYATRPDISSLFEYMCGFRDYQLGDIRTAWKYAVKEPYRAYAIRFGIYEADLATYLASVSSFCARLASVPPGLNPLLAACADVRVELALRVWDVMKGLRLARGPAGTPEARTRLLAMADATMGDLEACKAALAALRGEIRDAELTSRNEAITESIAALAARVVGIRDAWWDALAATGWLPATVADEERARELPQCAAGRHAIASRVGCEKRKRLQLRLRTHWDRAKRKVRKEKASSCGPAAARGGAGASLRPDRPARSRPTRARARSRRP